MTNIEDAARQAQADHGYDAYEVEHREPCNWALWCLVGAVLWVAGIKAVLFVWERVS